MTISNDAISVIITGSTGMVGEGVLHICLGDARIKNILVINRKPGGVTHPKLKEIIHLDFFDLSPIANELKPYTACFFCLGVSSIGMNEAAYTRLTHTLTLHVAETFLKQNKDTSFIYISGAGTDSTETGKSMWARVKGKTENDLMKLPFKNVFALRPGFIKPIRGLKHAHKFYKYINWLFPPGRKLYPKGFCTLQELAACMIHLATKGSQKRVLEGTDIIQVAKEGRPTLLEVSGDT